MGPEELGVLAGLAGKVRPVAMAGERLLPVLDPLAPLLPDGGLRRGSVVTVTGSTSLALALLAGASAAGSWCAAVGLSSLGVVAASELGVALDRFPLVAAAPDGDEWAWATAALLDAVDVVLARPPGRVRDTTVRRLASRARERSAVLLVASPAGLRGPNAMAGLRGPNAMAGLRGPNAMADLRGPNAMADLRGPNATAGLRGPNATAGLRGPNATAGLRGPNATAGLRGPNAMAVWPGADVRLAVTAAAWEGVGQGHGRLRARRIEVVATGRAAAARERRVTLWLPGPDGGVAAVAAAVADPPVLHEPAAPPVVAVAGAG